MLLLVGKNEPVQGDLSAVRKLENLPMVPLLANQLVDHLHTDEDEALDVDIECANPRLVLHCHEVRNFKQALEALRSRLKVQCHTVSLPLLHYEKNAESKHHHVKKPELEADFGCHFNQLCYFLSVGQILQRKIVPDFDGLVYVLLQK